jgi:KDO2-lipid IV(A) lauroyltransferase
MLKYYLFAAAQIMVKILPMSFTYRVAVVFADLFHWRAHADNRALTFNLQNILKRRPTSNELREVHRNFARYLAEFFLVNSHFTKSYLEQNVVIEGWSHLKKLHQKSRGAIIVTAHLGNWELGGVFVSHRGLPLTVVALPHKDESVNRFFNQRRINQNLKVVPPKSATKACLRALLNNEFVALLIDRDFQGRGLTVNVFGRQTRVPKGAAVMSIKSQKPVIPAVLVRTKQGQFVMKVSSPIEPPQLSNTAEISDDVLRAMLQSYITQLEMFIAQYPEQWCVFREFDSSS